MVHLTLTGVGSQGDVRQKCHVVPATLWVDSERACPCPFREPLVDGYEVNSDDCRGGRRSVGDVGRHVAVRDVDQKRVKL